MTQCKIRFTYQSHCVSKSVTPHRMLTKFFEIFQMNPEIISVPNMYDRVKAKVDCLAEKFTFVPEKTRKTRK